MNPPSPKPKITFEDFFFYGIGAAALAGFAIYANPTWPVVVGIVALCLICAAVFCFGWKHGLFESEEDAAAQEREKLEE